jgi:hypothetical protein
VKIMENGEEKEKPRAIAYTSRRFSPAEARWSTSETEAFAIKNAFCRFQSLIQGLHVIVESDHANHRFIYNAKTSAKIQRWRMFLEQFSYEIRHISGVNNEISDGLSRLHIRNLTLTAPTSEEAEVERKTGIITSSTHLVGVPGNAGKFVETKESEEEGGDDADGEGGMDEALFQGVQGGWEAERGVYGTPSLDWSKMPEMGVDNGLWNVEPSTEVCENALEAEWQEQEELGGEEADEQASIMEERSCTGKGSDC